MLGKIGGGLLLSRSADLGELAPVLLAHGAEIAILALAGLEQSLDAFTHRVRNIAPVACAQENPATFLAPFDETGGAQYPDMARYARLALPENLRHFAHR